MIIPHGTVGIEVLRSLATAMSSMTCVIPP
jgi:hypothetical protein